MPSGGLGPALLGASGHCGRPRVSGNHALLPGRPTGLSVAPTNGLAEGIAQSGKYDLTISAVAVDERNSGLEACLRKSGIAELRQGGISTVRVGVEETIGAVGVFVSGGPALARIVNSVSDTDYGFAPGRRRLVSPRFDGSRIGAGRSGSTVRIWTSAARPIA